MNILFFESGAKVNTGSHRIYMYNLKNWLAECGQYVKFVDDLKDANLEEFDVIIAGKRASKIELDYLQKNKRKDAIMGIANAHTRLLSHCEFYIADGDPQINLGSAYNANAIKFPLLEEASAEYKKHEDSDVVVVGYHGNLDHLNQMSSYMKEGFEELAKKYNIHLKPIYNIKDLGLWDHNRPEGIKILDTQWDVSTWQDELAGCDIGIVPNVLNVEDKVKDKFFKNHNIVGGYKEDWLFRYKSTVNAGRAFVFHQLGVPVVSEMYPEAYTVMGNINCGYVAQNKNTFVQSMEKLIKDASHRQLIADNAKAEFDRVYCYKRWTKHLITSLEELLEQHKQNTIEVKKVVITPQAKVNIIRRIIRKIRRIAGV